jgi:DNA-binding MarR family transcriptional regulator
VVESTDLRREWEHGLVYLLWDLSARASALGESALSGSRITLAGWGMLTNIGAHPGRTITEMSRRVPQTQQTLSAIAGRLEDLGLVERRLPPRGQGRGVQLFLSTEGEELVRSLQGSMKAVESLLSDQLGSQRYTKAVALLEDLQPIVQRIESSVAPS